MRRFFSSAPFFSAPLFSVLAVLTFLAVSPRSASACGPGVHILQADRVLERLAAIDEEWAALAETPLARAFLHLGSIAPDIGQAVPGLTFHSHDVDLSYHLLDSAVEPHQRLFALGHLTHQGADPACETFLTGTLMASAPLGLYDLIDGYDDAMGESEGLVEMFGDLVLGDYDGIFYCLATTTGKTLWKFEAEAEISSGANFYGDKVLFGSQDGALYCLDAATGGLVWKYSIDNQIRCTPTVVKDRAFVAGCDGQLHIVDLVKGTAAASVDIGGPTGVTPAVSGDRVYFGTENGEFFCVDWKRAAIVWTFADPKRSQPLRSSPAISGNRVVFGGRAKRIYCVDAKEGRLQWQFTTRQRVDSSPVIVANRVYAGAADGRFYAIDLKTGKEAWQYETGGGFTGSPAVSANRLVIATDDGVVYCFGRKDEENQ